jgi:ketosteroid isomerase-like protein
MRRLLVCLMLLLSTVSMAQQGTPTPAQTATPQATATPQTTATPQATATPEATSTPTAREGDEDPVYEELQLLHQHMQDAVNAQDIDSVLEGVGDDVVFTTMDGQVVRGKNNIRAYFDKMMTGPDAEVKEFQTRFFVDDLTILYGEPEGTRFGIAYGHSQDQYTLYDDTKFEVNPRWSATVMRDAESWKIVNFQYSVNMFDNPVVDKAMGKIAMLSCGGLVLGLLLGFFLGSRRS